MPSLRKDLISESPSHKYLRISITRVEVEVPLEGRTAYHYESFCLSDHPNKSLDELIALASLRRDQLIEQFGLYRNKESGEPYIARLITGYMVAVRIKPKRRITQMFSFMEYGDQALAKAIEFRDMLVLFRAGFDEQRQRHAVARTQRLKTREAPATAE